VHTAREIASLRGISVEDLARITTLNAVRLFGLGSDAPGPAIAYKIRDSLYLNVTNRCTNACSFCIRNISDYVKGHNLRLAKEPTAAELEDAIGEKNLPGYKEVVFCGYGEPTIRLDLVKEVAGWVKQRGGRVRLNTNGQGSLIHGRDILPELKGLVDAVSVSLDAQDADTYERLCKPGYPGAFEAVLRFIRDARKYIPEVRVTVVEAPGVDIEKSAELARELGLPGVSVRKLDVVG
jgi:TatD DNase family protein